MRLIAILCGLLTLGQAVAADAPDPRVKTMLDRLEMAYEVDQDHDYRVPIRLENDRTQTVYILSDTNLQGDLEVREVWSYGYLTKEGNLPPELMDALMAASRELILGAWELAKTDDSRIAILVAKIPVTTGLDALRSCLETVATRADAIDAEMNGKDEF